MSIENAISELKTLMGKRLCFSTAERKQYGQNETYYKEMLPDAVAYPKDEKEVSDEDLKKAEKTIERAKKQKSLKLALFLVSDHLK